MHGCAGKGRKRIRHVLKFQTRGHPIVNAAAADVSSSSPSSSSSLSVKSCYKVSFNALLFSGTVLGQLIVLEGFYALYAI